MSSDHRDRGDRVRRLDPVIENTSSTGTVATTRIASASPAPVPCAGWVVTCAKSERASGGEIPPGHEVAPPPGAYPASCAPLESYRNHVQIDDRQQRLTDERVARHSTGRGRHVERRAQLRLHPDG